MKAITLLFKTIVIGLLTTVSYAQIVANDDYYTQITGNTGSSDYLGSALANDTIDGQPITNLSDVIIQIIDSSEYYTLDSQGGVIGISYLSLSCYNSTFTYSICRASNPSECSVATVIIDTYFIESNAYGDVTVNLVAGGNDNYFANYFQIIDYWNNVNTPTCGYDVSVAYNPCPGLNASYALFQADATVAPGTCSVPYYASIGSAGVFDQFSAILNVVQFNLSGQGVYNDFNNNGYVDAGDVINYNYTIINPSTVDCNSISVQGWDWNFSVSGTLSVLPAGASDNTTFTATYTLTATDIMNGSVTNKATFFGFLPGVGNDINSCGGKDIDIVTNLGIIDGIKMVAFIDTNNNGIKETSESLYYGGQFQYEKNNDGIIHNLQSSFLFPLVPEIIPTNSYTIGYNIPFPYSTFYTYTGTNYTNVQIAQGSGINVYYFPVIEIPFVDVQVYLGNVYLRPGTTNNNPYVVIENRGNSVATSGTLTYLNSPNITITSLPAGATAIPNGFTFNFNNLLPNQCQYFEVSITVPPLPTVAIGEQVTQSAYVSGVAGDVYSYNDSFNNLTLIRGSYDPNIKTESHGREIEISNFTSNDYLNYTIQFENTGNADAIDIKVTDDLDSKLDPSTIRMIYASAPYMLEKVGNSLTWDFKNINLSPSIPDTDTGKGYIMFQIKPNPGYVVNDVIPNFANIYFDSNPAIVTPVCETQFVDTMSASQFEISKIKVSPNPIVTNLNIQAKSKINKVDIYDINAKIVYSNTFDSELVTIDFQNFSQGLYLVKVISDAGIYTQKIM